MTTIYDIAKATGFSPPTVSKALNNQSDIGSATKARIVEVAKQLGYIPNPNAKVLVTKKSWMIGIIFEEDDLGIGLVHPLFAGIMNAFKTRMESEGYELLFIARNLGRRKMSLLDHCQYRRVDAVLVLNCNAQSSEVHEIIQSGIPCVSSNIVFPDTCTVTSFNVEPSIQAVEYLYQLGHRTIAHIAGPLDPLASAALERKEGFVAGLAAQGLPLVEDNMVEAQHWNPESGYQAMMELWNRGTRPTAVYCAGDILSFGVLNACRELGVRIPEDLSLISFDDNEWAMYGQPPLTTFRQDRIAIGQASAELMLKVLAGRKVPLRSYIPVTLIERQSCQRV
ncbi:MAG: LacI family DNA-binding transcriptional regulator [Spirochaetia bacterium]|jgi:LacI family transcriptional regulator|nr:LacI family DNA-binding transcriptional regulator [Spirochaetia bacterium]